jgi:hypothetical protein
MQAKEKNDRQFVEGLSIEEQLPQTENDHNKRQIGRNEQKIQRILRAQK